jgi:DNA-binding NarL/FixJ family response regulator
VARRILIVEDEFLIAAALEDQIIHQGHTVCAAVATAQDAYDRAVEHRPDVVFMDVRLAGVVDGISAARMIRRTHRCAIVFLTAYSDKRMAERVRREVPGAILLSKPASDARIANAIRRARGNK